MARHAFGGSERVRAQVATTMTDSDFVTVVGLAEVCPGVAR